MRKLLLLGAILALGIAPGRAMTETTFGQRSAYAQGELRFGDFSLRFLERERHHPTGTALDAVTYTFAVIAKDRTLVTKLKFTRGAVDEGVKVFEVGGKKYAAEMFYSTSGLGLAPRWRLPAEARLNYEEILVWDESTARVNNPQLARALGDRM